MDRTLERLVKSAEGATRVAQASPLKLSGKRTEGRRMPKAGFFVFICEAFHDGEELLPLSHAKSLLGSNQPIWLFLFFILRHQGE
jgi:hypothetical protein